MRYWLYLIAKLAAIVEVVWVLQALLVRHYPAPPAPLARFGPARPLFLNDMLFTFATLGVWLIGAGLFSLALRDQRRRCRTCLRKLIMPIKTGSWGHIVMLGRPTTEMICPYGHGTLYTEELHITGGPQLDWQAHDDNIWKELESYHQAGK
jgi:hypothetical protein